MIYGFKGKRCLEQNKNDLKKLNCLRTDKISFLCLKTSETLSLGKFDESKTHLFLSPFFLHFLYFNVQFNVDMWNLHPYFVL